MYNWFSFPYEKDDKNLHGKYMYAVGGFFSPDEGCPGWGTSDVKRIKAIGDCVGHIVVEYDDGTENKIPLIFGYTMWYHSIWNERPAPFFGENKDEELIAALKLSLAVKGGWEGDKYGVIRIQIDDKDIKSIYVASNPEKEGSCVFVGGYICDADEEASVLTGGEVAVNCSDDFFAKHTVYQDALYPDEVVKAIQKIDYALHTFEQDFIEAPSKFVFPTEQKDDDYRIIFAGNKLAEIASGVVYYNMINLNERTDDDGFIHTSYKDAPSWRYDGFGPYIEKANSYYDSFYSRDAARAIMSLNSFGNVEKANLGCNFGNKWMMYYPEQNLEIMGEKIPGHFSVIPNKPLIYSTLLTVVAAWPTQYTKERFGEGYQNLGNQETDGHGLMMMANYLVWSNLGCEAKWVEDNWVYINEAAKWIKWCQEKPEISFARDGLLYGETEAAMNTYTLYANIPCYLGLLGYAQMARKIGKTEEASIWEECATVLKREIDKQLTKGKGWNLEHKGFIHDPTPTMMADIYGYDSKDMPQDWLLRSKESYEEDIKWVRTHGYFGLGGGVGYDHSMITQNALILDEMKDGGGLIESLCKLSYSPRLPEPYLVPEGLCWNYEKGVIFRQGDLGNLVQLAEAMKCYLIVVGIAPVVQGKLKIMPRLPKEWNVEVSGFKIQNSGSRIDMKVSYPENNKQEATVNINGDDVSEVSFRFGPFSMEVQEAEVKLNGQSYMVTPEISGDSKWAWITI